MENGYFQPSLSNHHLKMIEPESVAEIPLPNQLPATPQVPMELLKSATVQSLISQNEDLSARLNVAIKRQMLLENENETLKTSSHGLQTQFAAFSDQILIWKEKEKYWKSKYELLEQNYSQLKNRYPELEEMEQSLGRYRRYHEKVKLQIKPFIQQLKAYAENLGSEIRSLNKDIEQKELREQQRETEFLSKITALEKALHSEREKQFIIVQGYEKAREAMVEKVEDHSRLHMDLQMTLQENKRLKELEDELKNALISNQRDADNSQQALNAQMAEMRSAWIRVSSLLEHQQQEASENARQLNEKSKLLETAQRQMNELQAQLDSQRLLWGQQSQILEELRASNFALERINRELSLNRKQN